MTNKDFKKVCETLAAQNKRYRIISRYETFIVMAKDAEDAARRIKLTSNLKPGDFVVFKDE